MMDENTRNFRELMSLVYDTGSKSELDSLLDRTISWYLDGYLYDDDYDTIIYYIDAKMAKTEGR